MTSCSTRTSASTLAQVVFVTGSAALFSRVGLDGGLGLWPTTAPFVVQLWLVIALGDRLEYWTHRLTHKVAALGATGGIAHADFALVFPR